MSPQSRGPIVGITVNLENDQYRCRNEYALAVRRAGAVPILLPAVTESIPRFLELCDAFVTTGGDDPDTTMFGMAPHPKANLMDPVRQEFELELLESMKSTRHPLLAICLGMQLFALAHGGALEQHLPDVLESAEEHWGGRPHPISGCLGAGMVHSHHKQVMSSPGNLDIIARSHDDLIEAVRAPDAPHRIGVQWHPERTEEHRFGQGLFDALVESTNLVRNENRT